MADSQVCTSQPVTLHHCTKGHTESTLPSQAFNTADNILRNRQEPEGKWNEGCEQTETQQNTRNKGHDRMLHIHNKEWEGEAGSWLMAPVSRDSSSRIMTILKCGM